MHEDSTFIYVNCIFTVVKSSSYSFICKFTATSRVFNAFVNQFASPMSGVDELS